MMVITQIDYALFSEWQLQLAASVCCVLSSLPRLSGLGVRMQAGTRERFTVFKNRKKSVSLLLSHWPQCTMEH